MDRKKIIKEYEAFVDKYECFSSSDDYVLEMHKAVLALLKEQPEIVRCKDCALRNEINCPQYYRRTELSDDYFCANGERQ